jgi:hypothetical protein
MSIIKGLFVGLKNQKVIPFTEMTPELHNQISSGLAKLMMAAKMTKAKLTKSQREYIVNQAKQVQEFEDRYITKIKDSAGNIIKKGKEKVADVFDLEGRTLDPSKTIMGGTQEGAALKSGIMKATGAKPTKVPDTMKKRIEDKYGIKLKGDETMGEIQKLIDDLPTKKADGGRIGLKEGKGMFEELFYSKDRPILSGLNTAALFDLVVAAKDAAGPLLGFADGGRIGYKDGPDQPGRRKFMKIAGGILGALPFGGAKLLSKAAPVVSKAAELTGPALNKIVETVMTFGKMVSLKGKRVKEMVTKKKHEGVEVTEDVGDGSYIIKKGDKEIYYKPGRQDETGGFEDDIIEVIEKRIERAGGGGIGYMLGE